VADCESVPTTQLEYPTMKKPAASCAAAVAGCMKRVSLYVVTRVTPMNAISTRPSSAKTQASWRFTQRTPETPNAQLPNASQQPPRLNGTEARTRHCR
jgi:hypothetical protein